MDIPILIVIALVFLVSLCSLLFINKFFRRKTFEEIVAEKKALNEKIFSQNKTALKKPKKLQQLKKESKREKKQRQKEQQKDTTEQEDSDQQSEQPESVDEEPPQGLSKVHVEFEPDPEVVTFNADNAARRVSNAERENTVGGNAKQKSKKEKRSVGKSGILVNKNEPVLVKESPVVEEQLNNFDSKPPKDVVELKKQDKEKKEEKQPIQSNLHNKKEKSAKKEKHATDKIIAVEPAVAEVVYVAKEGKNLEEKPRHGSPKNQQQNATNNNNSNQNNNQNHKTKQQNKKQNKELAKEHSLALNKLSENDTIGVSLLMNLFRQAELNRSEIQILIDYLLNKQQDMPSSHSEWSDDICQKLKRQLEEKERLLSEEQEASIGIQAKLRELRTEINTERAQITATVKAYVEKIQSKEQEIAGLNQELQSLNEKLALERQQFQAKLLREKQVGTQDLLAQLQIMQNEMAHKDKVIAELTCFVNNSRQALEEADQKNEILQTQSKQIRALEQQRDELEEISNNRVFELEKVKTLETENAESKVDIRNLQNELESSKADLFQAHKDSEVIKAELYHVRNVDMSEKQKEIQLLQSKNTDLTQQLAGSVAQKFKEHSGLQVTLEALQTQLAQKEQEISEYCARNEQLVQRLGSVAANAQETAQHLQVEQLRIEALQADAAIKIAQLQQAQENLEKSNSKEKELLQQLLEQKEKNNQQQQLLAAAQKPSVTTTDSSVHEQKHIRELFQRLYPEAVKECAAIALSASFDHWVDQVLATHIKQSISKLNATNTTTTTITNSNKTTQANNTDTDSSNHNSITPNNLHLHDASTVSSEATNNNNGSENRLDSSSSSSSNNSDPTEVQKLHTQNQTLRAQIDELTKLVTKTSNTLSDLEGHAREQDEHWRSIVATKEEQISVLQSLNGRQPNI